MASCIDMSDMKRIRVSFSGISCSAWQLTAAWSTACLPSLLSAATARLTQYSICWTWSRRCSWSCYQFPKDSPWLTRFYDRFWILKPSCWAHKDGLITHFLFKAFETATDHGMKPHILHAAFKHTSINIFTPVSILCCARPHQAKPHMKAVWGSMVAFWYLKRSFKDKSTFHKQAQLEQPFAVSHAHGH